MRFEGAGDALMCGEILFCGYGFRSDLNAADFIRDTLKVKEIISCKLVDPYFYHLDTCFCPINEDTALIYPGAFDKESLDKINSKIKTIEVPEDDAKKFACNTVVLGKYVIVPAGCSFTCIALTSQHKIPYEVEMNQFLKAGGAAKCLTLLV